MSRSKAFNQVSFHPRARNIPHPDALRAHGLGNRDWASRASDDDLVAEYLVMRTVGNASEMNPFSRDSRRYSAYEGYLENEATMIRQDPAYRPNRSASDLRDAAKDHSMSVREDED
jgi:hypothetical protein